MTITLTREEAQQVLDALDEYRDSTEDFRVANRCISLIEILRARLSAPEPEYRDVVIKGDLWRIEFLPDHAASVVLVRANYEAQPEPEPVACPFPCGWKTMLSIIIKDGAFLARGLIEGETVTGHQREIVMRLIDYAKTMALHGMIATQREWQGLTDEEIRKLSDDCAGVRDETEFIRAIEAKLREKNA